LWVRGLYDEASAAAFANLVARTQRHLDGADRRLVAADAGLGHAARGRGGLGAGAGSGHAGEGAGRPHRLAKFALGSLFALATHISASLDGDARALRFVLPADTLDPPAGLAGHLPTRWGGVRTGRRLGELVLRRWVRLGKGSARLSLGRGTQPAGSWATICCVPGAVITPNVVAVKTFRCLAV